MTHLLVEYENLFIFIKLYPKTKNYCLHQNDAFPDIPIAVQFNTRLSRKSPSYSLPLA